MYLVSTFVFKAIFFWRLYHGEIMEKLTYEKLHEALTYNEKTGIFNWKIRRDETGRLRGRGGKIAGNLRSDGYISIGINGKGFRAHRLAWLYKYGYFPENQIDHLDQIRHHNWVGNLREATRACNMQNQKVNLMNKSGVTGVGRHKSTGKWEVHIKKNNKKIHLGYFTNLIEAAKVRYEAEQKYFTCVIKSSAKLYIENYQTGE